MSEQQTVSLIVGLGNPGPRYQGTRHNAGFWFLDALMQRYACPMRPESKFKGQACRAVIEGHELWLLRPDTFMNLSGQSVAALAGFYKIPPTQILVAHDELDLAPGTVRLKRGGGHGGHNGLRSMTEQLGSRDFLRLRVGIGHPGHRDLVHDYVLSKPSAEDREAIQHALEQTIEVLPQVVAGDLNRAMNSLHAQAN